MKKYLFILTLLFISCQKEITFDLPAANEKIVVEGSIEQGFPPYVLLTRNEGYFEPVDTNTYNNLFIKDAIIKVWTYNEDGTKDSVMLEQLPAPFDSISIYTDINVITNPGFEMRGEIGKTYNLEIQWNNQIITSSTTIPEPTPLDCLWVEKNPNSDEIFECDIRAIYSDPADIENNVLVRSKRTEHWKKKKNNNGIKNDNDPFLILVDAGPDILINGESFETFFPKPREQGGFPSGNYNTDRYETFNENGIEDSVFLPHDVVLIKFCQIDKPSLMFWRGVVRQVTSGGNPFAEPANLSSNINGGLGTWTGYGAAYYKVPIIEDTTIFEQYDVEITDIF